MNEKLLHEMRDVLDPREVQVILNIGRSKTYTYLKQGRIKSIRIGNRYRIPKKYIFDFLYSDASTEIKKKK